MFYKEVSIKYICKCDRCGVEYTYEQKHLYPPTREELMNRFGIRRTMNGEDICPNCFNEYIITIGGAKNGENNQ